MKAQRAESLDVGVFRDTWLFSVAGILGAHQILALQRTHGPKDLGFLVVDGSKVPAGRRLHGKQCDHLEEMILDHVAQTAGRFVKGSAAFHSEILGQGYLDAGHIIAIPDRFQERIGEAEIEDIHDRLFSEEVIDAKDRVFREHTSARPDSVPAPKRGRVQRASRR